MVPETFSRTAMLVGEEGMAQLLRSKVAVVGIGGVGAYVVEALARAGIGGLLLVDDDTVALSNINRQLHAMHSTLGQYKTRVMAERVRDIHPGAEVVTREQFCLADNVAEVLAGEWDYVVDAVDTVSAKLAIIAHCKAHGIPVASAMGAGNKLDARCFQVTDIAQTQGCPLCRVMRRELRKRGIAGVKVVYSPEPAMTLRQPASGSDTAGHPKRQTPGSISYVPAVAGLLLAGEVIRDLLACGTSPPAEEKSGSACIIPHTGV